MHVFDRLLVICQPTGEMVGGLRSTDNGLSWQALHQLGHFGVCGYDLTTLSNGWIVASIQKVQLLLVVCRPSL